MALNGSGWYPRSLTRFVRSFGSALRTSYVETDVGYGYLKGLGNPEGPHCLACELVGTSLAEWLGAPTLDYAILNLTPQDEVPFSSTEKLDPGAAFITRVESGASTWGGDSETLLKVTNKEAISQLVVLDTWLRNCDRYAPDGGRRNYDNVLLVKHSEYRGAFRLLAMDFTHAFTCGHMLTKKLANIEFVRDVSIYCLFPEFVIHLDRDVIQSCLLMLEGLTVDEVSAVVRTIPREWQVSGDVSSALLRFIVERAHFLADHMQDILWPQLPLGLGE